MRGYVVSAIVLTLLVITVACTVGYHWLMSRWRRSHEERDDGSDALVGTRLGTRDRTSPGERSWARGRRAAAHARPRARGASRGGPLAGSRRDHRHRPHWTVRRGPARPRGLCVLRGADEERARPAAVRRARGIFPGPRGR